MYKTGGKMAATIIESFFQRGLEDLVKGLRVQVIGEAAFLSKALDEVRKEIKSMDMNTKAVALQKLTYLSMLQGTDMGWAAFHVVEVMSTPKFSLKKIGYLAASQSFNESTDVLLLITNLLRKDFCGMNDHEASLAIECFSRVATADLARDLLPELFSELAGGRAFVRKKATVALSRVFTKYPDAMRVALKRLIERLSDGDTAVVTAAISVLCDLAMKDPKSFLPLAPELYNLLVRSPNTWLCIKLVKMLRVLIPLEPRLGKKIADPICELMRKSQATSLLLECIQAVTSGLTEQQGAVMLCVEKLNELVEADDTNIKYLCLRALSNLMPVHPWAVAANKGAIAKCLNHKDPSIQKGARRLIIGMVSESNVIPTVHLLLQCAFKADADSCNELVSNLLSTCSSDDYFLISDFSWYVSSLAEMARIPHCECGDELGRQLIDIGLRVKSATCEVLRAGRDLLLDVTLLDRFDVQGVLKAAAWIAGEYVACSVNLYELVEAFLQPRTMSLPASVRAVYVQAVLKVFVYSWSKLFIAELSLNTGITYSSHHFAENVSVDQDISQAVFSVGQSTLESEAEDFLAQHPGGLATKNRVCGCESQSIDKSFNVTAEEGSMEFCSGDYSSLEQIQMKGDILQTAQNWQDKSARKLGEERGRGRALDSQEQKEDRTPKEQQSLLGFFGAMFVLTAERMITLATSSDVEMQERACNVLGVLQVIEDISSFPLPDERRGPEVQVFDELLAALREVLIVEFSPVSVHAQGSVTAVEGLILENLDALRPMPSKVKVSEGVGKREAMLEWEGRKYFSFQYSNPSAVGESTVLLARHRQRHQNFYLPSGEKSANTSFDYPLPVEAYIDPERLPRSRSTDSFPLGEGTKRIRFKARPVIVKLDDDGDHIEPSLKSKQKDLKDNFISSAIIDMLSGGSGSAQKYQVTAQHSSRLSTYLDRDNSFSHASSPRVDDGYALGRKESPALARDAKPSNASQGPGTIQPTSRYRHLGDGKERISSSPAAGYEPRATKSPGRPIRRARLRRLGDHKATSLWKKFNDAVPFPETNARD